MKRHMQVHNGDKPYSCSEFGKVGLNFKPIKKINPKICLFVLDFCRYRYLALAQTSDSSHWRRVQDQEERKRGMSRLQQGSVEPRQFQEAHEDTHGGSAI